MSAMNFFYGTAIGRGLFKGLLALRLPKLMARYLHSPLSKGMVCRYIKKYNISMEGYEEKAYPSFAAFFARKKQAVCFDAAPSHLISPCDSLLSVFPIDEKSGFAIKNSYYRLEDLIADKELCKQYQGGDCLIFRLTATDYHHYLFIDKGYLHQNHYIEGKLHSVQPIACDAFPVYRLNRRSWVLMETENFGKVVQTEVGAMAVGGIENLGENRACEKGEEKGYFSLCGSTILLFFEKGKIALLKDIQAQTQNGKEHRVKIGEWIGSALQ